MRVRCPVALVTALVALLFVPSRLEAACASSVPMTHGVETFFTCMNVNPVAAFAYQQSDPAGVNTGGVRISCEARDDDSCFGMSGVAGDGRMTIETDWGSPGVLGCPISSSGPQRVIIALASTWGRFGQGLIVSLGGAAPSLGYAVKAAHPFDPTTNTIQPLRCDQTVTGEGIPGQISLQFSPPIVHTDCDIGTVGDYLPACGEAFLPTLSLGSVYTLVQPCADPIDIRKRGWTNTGVVPDATGLARINVSFPPAGLCRSIGSTTIIDGVESEAITGYVFDVDCADRDGDGSFTCARDCDGILCKVDCDDTNPAVNREAPELCNGIDDNCDGRIDEEADADGDGVGDCRDNCPTVVNPDQNLCVCAFCGARDITIDFSSEVGKGSGTVSWSTGAEVGFLGFNIVMLDNHGARAQLNRVTIPCEGCVTGAGHLYTYVIPKHKSGRNIFIEIVRRDGSTQMFGPAQRL